MNELLNRRALTKNMKQPEMSLLRRLRYDNTTHAALPMSHFLTAQIDEIEHL